MTEPLTPEDCDLRDFPYLPLDVARLRDSDLATTRSPEECWAAVLLWCASWHQVPAASLPDNDMVLSNLAGYGRVVKEWMRVKEGAMHGWIKCSDGRLYHPVIAEKANAALEDKAVYRYGRARDRARKAHGQSNEPFVFPTKDEWSALGMPKELPVSKLGIPGLSSGIPELSSGIPAEIAHKESKVKESKVKGLNKENIPASCEADPSPKKPSPRQPRKTSLPESFGISDSVRQWAADKKISNLEEHLESFKLKAQAKNYQYANWDAAFRNAIADDWAGLSNRGTNSVARPSSRASPTHDPDASARFAARVMGEPFGRIIVGETA